MNPIPLETIVAWYHHDESQLLVMLGLLVATAVGALTAIASTSWSIRWKTGLGCAAALSYLACASYTAHLVSRMTELRTFLMTQSISEEYPIAYLHQFAATDWNRLPALLYGFSLFPIVLSIAHGIGQRYERVRLPRVLPT